MSKKLRAALYIRCSTADQNTSLQRKELTAFARARGWEIIRVFEDKASGKSTEGRPQFKAVLEAARKRQIDLLVTWKLDRAFRSLRDCMNTLHELAALGVEFCSMNDNGIDMTTPQGKLLLSLLASFAEFERGLIVQRVRAGLREARRKGIQLGRPKQINATEVRRLSASGKSIGEIAKVLGHSKAGIHKVLKRPE